MKIYIANNAESLRKLNPAATVEAEFGDEVVEGSQVTLAHHGSRSSNLPPCVADVGSFPQEGEIIAVSHFDLDTLGGVMRVLGHLPGNPMEDCFWDTAAKLDVRGVHRMGEVEKELAEYYTWGRVLDVRTCMNGFHAWSSQNRLFAPEDGSALDCTEFFQKAIQVVLNLFTEVLEDYGPLISAGARWVREQELLEELSYRGHTGTNYKIVVREAEKFVNHLYNYCGGVADVVVGRNSKTGNITVSKERPEVPLNCCAFVQEQWGPKAGGHEGIAGGPRDQEFSFADAEKLAEKLAEQLG